MFEAQKHAIEGAIPRWWFPLSSLPYSDNGVTCPLVLRITAALTMYHEARFYARLAVE